ncbi:hypothetical protein V866_005974 [Kwoniella sp. B9012]
MPAARDYHSNDDREALKKIPELFIRGGNFYMKIKKYYPQTDEECCHVIMNPKGAADELCGDAMTTTGEYEMMCMNHIALLNNAPVPVDKVFTN